MAIRFACPVCAAEYTVNDRFAGKKSDCKVCGQRLQVPNPNRARTVLGKLVGPPPEPSPPPAPEPAPIPLIRHELPGPTSERPPRRDPEEPLSGRGADRRPRGRNHTYTVRVSARILHFPELCCCCGLEAPRNRYRAQYTRTTGVRVIRHHTKWWEFPACGPCLRWIDAEAAASGKHYAFVSLAVVATILLLGGAVVICAGISARAGGGVVLGLLGTAAGLVCGCLTPLAYAAWKKADEYAAYLVPDGATSTAPVEYHGWDGSVHTFEFSHRRFCDRFIGSNRGKVLGY